MSTEFIILVGSKNYDAMEKSLNKAAAMMVNQTTTGYAAAEPTECTSIDTPGNWLLSRVDTNLYTDYKDSPRKGKGSWKSPYKFHK